MNKLLGILITIAWALFPCNGYSQDNNNAWCTHTGAKNTIGTYRQGEVLVKFRNENAVSVRKSQTGKFLSSGLSKVDKVLKEIAVNEMTQLMPLSGKQVSPRRMKTYSGSEVEDHDLSQLYHLRFNATGMLTVTDVVEKLQAMEEVEYAEPNYLVYTQEIKDYTADPLFSDQGYLWSINVPQVWSVPNVKAKRPVVAIIDTGVQIDHPDLQDNIWTNTAETEGTEGIDDDGNGFKDDIHGWDFVNKTGHIGDWNGHGTHCAGLAAAVGGNGIGIVGANPEALIMPVTVMQSDGTGDVATIIKGIDYAFANGADVISMSIGSYQHSMAEEQALAKAYSRCVLVAAAGNDCRPINSKKCKYCCLCGAPCFPAAYTFVLGVVASDAMKVFTNYDDDGPTYSEYNEEKQYNYELKAPGVNILSTYPGGRYKLLSGTSMACPMVAGAISRLLQTKEYDSFEILFGDLIHTSDENYVNIAAAYSKTDDERKPTLSTISIEYRDPKGDNDGRLDAGEIVELWPTLQNDWGTTDNDIKLTLEMGENENPALVEFLDNDVEFGYTLSSYAKCKTKNPLRIRLKDDIVDGRHINMVLKATCGNISKTMEHGFTIRVENGVELGGTQRTNITLYPNVHYIVTRNWGIPKDVIVTVKAGTTLKIKDGVGISNYGYINFVGNPDSMIVITKGDNDLGYIGGFLNDNANYVNFNNVIFENLSNISFSGHTYEHCIMRSCNIIGGDFSSGATLRDCSIYNNTIGLNSLSSYLSSGSTFVDCNVFSNEFVAMYGGFGSAERFYRSNFIGNQISCSEPSTPGVYQLDESNCYGNYYDALGGYYSIVYNTTEPEIAYLSECYLGTSSEDVAYESILDEVDNVGWGHVDVWKMMKSANPKAPGCVDYILVDNFDPQDEADLLPPLGVGQHEVKVVFNRAMDKNYTPWITMGVRPPYTQKSIEENGYWDDPYTYVSHITINGKTASDGMNRIRVMDYMQKNSDFQMPQEYYRYNVNVQVAGSLSTGMVAVPGMGKVTLNWETDQEDFADLQGYNLYRFTRDDEGTSSDTLLVNQQIIESTETEYVDYDVVPGSTYYYFIREIGTDFTQIDVSTTVAATPFTAEKGDANGSMKVDIADVMAEIAYLSGENPQPFIFEAADVNNDGSVDILDVVNTLRMITSPQIETNATDNEEVAYAYLQDGILNIDAPVAIGGVQVMLKAAENDVVKMCSELSDLEQLNVQIGDARRILLAYSMSGKVLSPGIHQIAELPCSSEDIKDIVLSTPRGVNVKVVMINKATNITDIAPAQPNTQGIFDLQGRRLSRIPDHGIVIVNGKKLCF